MASYLSTQVTPPTTAIGLSMGPIVETFSLTVNATTGAGDTYTLCQIPLNATILDVYFSLSGSLGTGITMNVGDTTSATRYASASTSFAGALEAHINAINNYASGALPFTYTTQTVATIPAGLVLDPSGNVADYLVLARAAGGSAVTVTLKGYMLYTLNKAS